ncbi:long-chain acyl-CoA synthetase [Fusarium oxysporum f. sp. conglutinans race 2 54008]|uniref:Long-chain acyl-CoA synthetase n=1 Tax=Fusarium oxysporum f. sp. conglutinans race 2 54008 TaxID=1089457 RepID=X0H1A4_FUSOX|nr:long-chain acyl-CoA synthetase [Fusarium oxysporum f. sp. conglutinans race 2 54008]
MALCRLDNGYAVDTCGAVTPACEACLQDVRDIDYFSTDLPHLRGELRIRGPPTSKSYFGNEPETSKALDPDGWFHTGDICSVDERGRLRLIDRLKDFCKLSRGGYISPELIENIYLRNCSWFAAVYVHRGLHRGGAVDPGNIDSLLKALENRNTVKVAIEAGWIGQADVRSAHIRKRATYTYVGSCILPYRYAIGSDSA